MFGQVFSMKSSPSEAVFVIDNLLDFACVLCYVKQSVKFLRKLYL